MKQHTSKKKIKRHSVPFNSAVHLHQLIFSLQITFKYVWIWDRGGARRGPGGLQPPRRRHLDPPSEEILGSRRRKFGEITHENTIFQSI